MNWGFTLDQFDTVIDIVKSRNPIGCKNEKNYEESLFQELIAKLKKQNIQREYGSGRQRIDIVVHDKVPVEIKYRDSVNINKIRPLIILSK